MYHMLNSEQQKLIRKIERQALSFFIEDLLSVCNEQAQSSQQYKDIEQKLN
jgi:hypothetical protein